MNSYKNFLPDLFFNKLNDIVTSNNFQWYFQEKTVRNKLLEGETIKNEIKFIYKST